MRRLMLAAAAVLALAACNQQGGSGPALPTLQAGAQAPSTQTPPTGEVRQVQITDENRRMVEANILDMLNQLSAGAAQGATAPEGFEDRIVALQPGTDSRFVMRLTGGTPYTFVGVCDVDCNNVDIELIDMRTGGVVGSDLLPDDIPIVNFTPTETGEYMVRTLLQTCTGAPCYTGTRALAHSGSASAGK
jgi:hypothetical protein